MEQRNIQSANSSMTDPQADPLNDLPPAAEQADEIKGGDEIDGERDFILWRKGFGTI